MGHRIAVGLDSEKEKKGEMISLGFCEVVKSWTQPNQWFLYFG